jgi:hypothetical protein
MSVKIPKYIQKELSMAADYVNKSHKCIENFEQWITNNVDKNFDFSVLYGFSQSIPYNLQSEALSYLELGNQINIEELERAIENYINR